MFLLNQEFYVVPTFALYSRFPKMLRIIPSQIGEHGKINLREIFTLGEINFYLFFMRGDQRFLVNNVNVANE